MAGTKPRKGTECPDTGWRRFRDRTEANLRLATIMRESTRAEVPIRAYPCKFCLGYHLTKEPRRG